MLDPVDLTDEDINNLIANSVAILGFLQGRLPVDKLPKDFLAEIDAEGLLDSEDKGENITKYINFLQETVGSATTVGVLGALVATDYLLVNTDDLITNKDEINEVH